MRELADVQRTAASAISISVTDYFRPPAETASASQGLPAAAGIVLKLASKERPAWESVLLIVLVCYALFCAVVLFLAFWRDFLPQSVWFGAPILLIALALTWLARRGLITPHVVLTVSALLTVGAALTVVVHLTGWAVSRGSATPTSPWDSQPAVSSATGRRGLISFRYEARHHRGRVGRR
jgi:hypothetical protein